MWMQPVVDAFPYQAREDGSCEKLKDNRCTVYFDRPLLCNIDRMADETDMPMNKETWFKMNYIGCKQLQMEIV
jgi:Fe-S-cluster containining protein